LRRTAGSFPTGSARAPVRSSGPSRTCPPGCASCAARFPAHAPDGRLARDGARLLGRPSEFYRLDAGRSLEPLPKSLTLQVASPGTLTGVLFTLSLAFGDDVFSERESLGWIAEPLRVEPGERVSLSLDARWRETNALGLALHELQPQS